MRREYDNVLYYSQNNIFFFNEKGYLEKRYDSNPAIKSTVSYDIRQKLLEAGYRERSLVNIRDILGSMVGLSEKELLKEIQKRGKNSIIKHKRQEELDKRWEKVPLEMKSYIIGMKWEYFRLFDDGFSVTVLLKKTVNGHKDYILSHQKNFLSYVCCEIEKSSRISKKIGDLWFYKPHKMIFRKRKSEVEVLFVIKDGIEKNLQEAKEKK